MRLLVAAFAVMSFAFIGAADAQTYAPLTYSNVTKTLVRFGALNLNNDKIMDDYIKLNDCDFFFKNFRDDFALQKRRQQLRAEVPKKMGTFPDAYYFSAPMRLDRYDFKTRVFMLESKSQLHNINTFQLVKISRNNVCIKEQRLESLPEEVGVVLDQPVTLEGLPISEEQSKKLVDSMNARKNFQRVIYARFSVVLVYAEPLDVTTPRVRYNAEAQLLSIEFFEDEKMTKPIWVYTRA